MQGGSVTVTSDVACGSRFTISLPWRIPLIGAALSLVAPSTLPPAADLPLVLIADDHALVNTTLSAMLMQQRVQTVVVQDGADALEKAALLHPALLLIDMQLPTVEGTAILAALRNEAHLQTTPIIAMSAVHWPGREVDYLAAGANAHVCKPIGQKQLQELITQWLPIATEEAKKISRNPL